MLGLPQLLKVNMFSATTDSLFSLALKRKLVFITFQSAACKNIIIPHIPVIWIELDFHVGMLLQQCCAVKVPTFSAFRIFHRRERKNGTF